VVHLNVLVCSKINVIALHSFSLFIGQVINCVMMSVMIINNFAMLEIHNLHLNSILKVLQTIIKI